MPRVVVTGGAGFIGSHLCERLVRAGYDVLAVDNFDPYYSRDLKEENVLWLRSQSAFTLLEADVMSPEALEQIAASAPDCVIHLAAMAGVRYSLDHPDRFMAVNGVASARLLECCRKAGVQRVILASSSSVYGDRVSGPFLETDPVNRPISPYAASKRAMELMAYSFHHSYGTNVTCLRFFTVYGPRQRPEMAIGAFVRKVRDGTPITLFGDGSSRRDYTFVEDIAAGIEGAMAGPGGYHIYNVARGEPVSLNTLVETVESVVGKDAVVRRTGDQMGDVGLTWADVSRASEDFGYRPAMALRDGIQRYLDWLER